MNVCLSADMIHVMRLHVNNNIIKSVTILVYWSVSNQGGNILLGHPTVII